MLLVPFAQAPAPDLRLKIVPVSEAVAALAKASGMALDTSPAVADRKITVLLRHTPAKEAMARIADVMRLRWEAVDGRTRLVADPVVDNRERVQVAAERAARQAALRKDVERKARFGALSPGQIKRLAAEAEARMKKPGDSGQSFEDWADLSGMAMGYDRAEAVALAMIGPEGRRRLLAGEPMLFSAGRNPVGIRLPSSALPQDEDDESRTTRIVFVLQTSPDGSELQTLEASESAGGSSMTGGLSYSTGVPNLPEGFAPTEFLKEMQAWDDPKPTDPATLRRLDAKTPVRPSEWLDGAQTDADRLEWLHDAGDVDVVARADRLKTVTTDPFARMPRLEGVPPRPSMGLAFDGTVGAFLVNWRRRQRDYFRFDRGVLMMRPAAYWSRSAEPSEAVLRRIESAKEITPEGWGALASGIQPAQAVELGSGRLAVRRSMEPLVATPALRFWATLTPAQRAASEQRELLARDLSPVQRAAYRRAVLEASRYGVFLPKALAAELAGDDSGVRFSLSRGEWNSSETGATGPSLDFSFADGGFEFKLEPTKKE